VGQGSHTHTNANPCHGSEKGKRQTIGTKKCGGDTSHQHSSKKREFKKYKWGLRKRGNARKIAKQRDR